MTSIVTRCVDGGSLRIEHSGGRVVAIEPSDSRATLLALPGLVDLQVNGFGGIDVNASDVDANAIVELTRRLWERGVTAYCPTVVTASQPRILAALRAIAAARAIDPLVARSIAGIHVEGPYLSDDEGARGAHDLGQLRDPDLAEFFEWQASCDGLVRIVTLAPERRGALEFIASVSALGVTVSIGHTAAEAEQIRAAVAAGARMSTHLGNGTALMMRRHPNHIWTQLADDRLVASFIGDGHHLPADAFTSMVSAKGVRRSVLVSDSVALAGCTPGVYATPVGGQVEVHADGRVTLAGSEFLAGGGQCLLDAIGWVTRSTGIGLHDAMLMASANPARVLGLPARDEASPDAAALTIVSFDEEHGRIDTQMTIVDGHVVYDRNTASPSGS